MELITDIENFIKDMFIDFDITNIKKIEPLLISIYHNHLKFIKLMLNKQQDINVKSEYINIALIYSIHFGTKEITDYLISEDQKIKVSRNHKIELEILVGA